MILLTLSEASVAYAIGIGKLKRAIEAGDLQPAGERLAAAGPAAKHPVPVFDPADVERVVLQYRVALPVPQSDRQESLYALIRHQRIERHWRAAS